MAKVSALFGDKFLNADALTKEGRDMEICAARIQDIGGEDKLVLTLRDDKGTETLPLNRTNADALAAMHGDDTDEWEGKRANFYRDATTYQGKRVGCVRVRQVMGKGSGSGSGSGSGNAGK